MEFTHSCSFCGWSRESATPVMLAPACERCGCALDATVVPRGSVAAAPVWVATPAARWALRGLGLLFALLGLYAAAKLGYDAGGASGGMIAFGVGGFLLLPFVPQRSGEWS